MKDDKFIKLTKKQKLEMKYAEVEELGGISVALFIPLREKNDGYTMCAFFVKKDDKWYRMMDYDCFRFINSQNYLKGDFENNGIQFFLNNSGDEKWIVSYGGEFKRLSI